MTCVINPRDVLEYLHELGYRNISADQLKEFIKGKKLIIRKHLST